jgi:hypothetical protein
MTFSPQGVAGEKYCFSAKAGGFGGGMAIKKSKELEAG